MTTTFAQLIGLEDELVREYEVQGLPTTIRMAWMPTPRYYVAMNDPDPVALRHEIIEFERLPGVITEMLPNGDLHHIATYRRVPIINTGTKEPRNQ